MVKHDNCYHTLAEEWSDFRLITVSTITIILLARTDSLKKRLANVNQAIFRSNDFRSIDFGHLIFGQMIFGQMIFGQMIVFNSV